MIRVNADLAEVVLHSTLVDSIPNVDEEQYQYVMAQLRKDASALAAYLSSTTGVSFTVRIAY